MTPAEATEALRKARLPLINGVPYDQPSTKDFALDYLSDTYGLPGWERTTVRALYTEARGKPTGWGTDFPGFMQRYGSGAAITSINGTTRLGLELLLHEDLRYLPCVGCSFKRKLLNALITDVTARHGEDGHRSFSLSPTISDFSGPIIAHTLWYPTSPDPFAGVVATRAVFATRVGVHLFQEYMVELKRKHQAK
jgi:hypothetical protein